MRTIGAVIVLVLAFALLCLLWVVDKDAFRRNGMNS